MQVVVIGGGPAGMMAAATAAQQGHQVTLLEKNEKLGKKLFITGKGRCNLTNAGGQIAFFNHVVRNRRFLYSAYSACGAEDIMALMERLRVPTKIERGDRVFPVSDKSSDVIRAMEAHLRDCGVQVRLRTAARGLIVKEGRIASVALGGETLHADALILATGGLSYPTTGSTGDGYIFAQALGHSLVQPLPALAPLETEERWPAELAGLTLKNVRLRATEQGKKMYEELGELLFAHFGVTGPLVLSASSFLSGHPKGAELSIDLKPGLDAEQLDRRLLRDVEQGQRLALKNTFASLLPKRLLPAVLAQAGLDGGASASEFSREDRRRLGQALKGLRLTVRTVRPIQEAIITRGGIPTNEVHPGTLQSRLVKGLYFAGELLDVDAQTGGYNLQIAWSTGALAGQLKGLEE